MVSFSEHNSLSKAVKHRREGSGNEEPKMWLDILHQNSGSLTLIYSQHFPDDCLFCTL